VWVGIWGPNIAFATFGLWTTFRQALPWWARVGEAVAYVSQRFKNRSGAAPAPGGTDVAASASSRPRALGLGGFPRLIDRMILSDLARHVAFVVAGLTLIFLVFTVFELVAEIVQNGVSYAVVVGYILYLAPQVISFMAPLAVLVGVMVTFGLMAGGSQIVALKASGQSIYRLAVPVFGLALALSIGLFALQNFVLPTTNRQQEDLRQQIRSGKEPPRTVYQVDRQWIFGKSNRIYYYRHYDPSADKFAELNIFDLDPETFRITRRIWASTATWEPESQSWLLEYGWLREFEENRVTASDAFRQQRLQVPETPDYFKRPVSEADKLTYGELRDHIDDLSRSGFDVLDLRIDLESKFAFPLTCLVMAFVGLPFAFSVGKRGALFGVAVGLAIGLLFWGALGLFTQMGRYELLPPALAAWGPNLLFGAGGAYLFLTTRT
jgi:LPS export ABC transporter permease LptG